MKTKCFAIAVLIVLSFAAFSYAAEDKLANFTFEGVSLSSSLNDFQRRYPSAEFDAKHSDATVDIKSYMVLPTKTADAAVYCFYQNVLYQIYIIYFPDTIEKMGGMGAVIDKLKNTFGLADNVDKQEGNTIATWERPESHRRVDFSVIPKKSAGFTVVDTAIESEIQKRRGQLIDSPVSVPVPAPKVEPKSQVPDRDLIEVGADLLKGIRQMRENWENRTSKTVKILRASLEISFLSDTQSDVLQEYLKTVERLHAEGMSQFNGIERDLMEPTSIRIRYQRLKQLDQEWKEAAKEFVRRGREVGLQ